MPTNCHCKRKQPLALSEVEGEVISILRRVEIATATFSGLAVDGAGKGNVNYRMEGIAFHNAGGAVQNCEIKDVRDTPLGGAQHGVGIYAYNEDSVARTITVSDSTLYGYQKNGLALVGTNLTANVDGNTVTGAGPTGVIAQNGIQLASGATGTVSNNTVSDHWYLLTEGSEWWSAGILLLGTSGTVSCTGNTVFGNEYGITLQSTSGGGTFTNNDIYANADGIGQVHLRCP